MHYAVFWIFESHICLHCTLQTTAIIRAYRSHRIQPVITASPLRSFLSRWLVIVVLVLDVVYG